MAQMGIPMSNKVGQSMYWSSMWDNKINYTRSLKEDIYLRKMMDIFFEDKVTVSMLKIKKKLNKNKINISKYYLHTNFKEIDRGFLKYLSKRNNVKMYSSKLWIFKYQKWLILFYFIYLPAYNSFNKFSDKILKKENDDFLEDFFNLQSYYTKVSLKSIYSYNCFKKWNKHHNF